MTASVSNRFESLKTTKNSVNSCGLIPFIMAGDPDLETTARALKVLDRCGASAIELGVPYSDPLADGPVIQAAATRALGQGIKFDSILAMLAKVIPQLNAPLILFTYYNPILYRGIECFRPNCRSRSSGLDRARSTLRRIPLTDRRGGKSRHRSDITGCSH